MLTRARRRNVPANAGEVDRWKAIVSDLIVGLMMAVFGLIGLFLVAGAADVEMYIFGLALCVFAVCVRFRPDQAPFRPARRDCGRGTGKSPCLTSPCPNEAGHL